jgi:endonuclease YncB( thermonuclease family)
MAGAIEQKGSLTVGQFALGMRGGVTGSVRQQVHDGDTLNVRAIGNFGVRFLGVDAPEISFQLQTNGPFLGLASQQWRDYLANPFAAGLAPFNPALNVGLIGHLQPRFTTQTALNHHEHASAAEDEMERLVLADIATLGQDEDTFRFFMAFAHEVTDRYGRLLGFINREQPSGPRPLPYNERLLASGHVSPYFIWPNINPFRKSASVTAAVIPAGHARTTVDADASFSAARQSIRVARQQHLGVYDAGNPLTLQPFEVRFLARRQPPDRWVIDLSKNNDELIPPQEYFTIPNEEDRLFIPSEYVPLFVEAGWRRL